MTILEIFSHFVHLQPSFRRESAKNFGVQIRTVLELSNLSLSPVYLNEAPSPL